MARNRRTGGLTRPHFINTVSPLKNFAHPYKPSDQRSATGLRMVAVAISISGSRHAPAPPHQLHCQTVGSAGSAVAKSIKDTSLTPPAEGRHQITVYLNVGAGSGSSDNLSRILKPTVREPLSHPGDTASTLHTVQNLTNEAKPGIPTHHIGPSKAGIYLNKTQRPRLEEQRPKAGETTETPAPLHTDPDSEKDPKMKDVDSATPAHVSMETDDPSRN